MHLLKREELNGSKRQTLARTERRKADYGNHAKYAIAGCMHICYFKQFMVAKRERPVKNRMLPIVYKTDGPLERPFVLNWAEADAQSILEGSTSKAEDTCLSEVIASIAPQSPSENIISTQSGIQPGALVDTSF